MNIKNTGVQNLTEFEVYGYFYIFLNTSSFSNLWRTSNVFHIFHIKVKMWNYPNSNLHHFPLNLHYYRQMNAGHASGTRILIKSTQNTENDLCLKPPSHNLGKKDTLTPLRHLLRPEIQKCACVLISSWTIELWSQFLKNWKSDPQLWRHYPQVSIKRSKIHSCSTTYGRNTKVCM